MVCTQRNWNWKTTWKLENAFAFFPEATHSNFKKFMQLTSERHGALIKLLDGCILCQPSYWSAVNEL